MTNIKFINQPSGVRRKGEDEEERFGLEVGENNEQRKIIVIKGCKKTEAGSGSGKYCCAGSETSNFHK
jgi:hypothetical protein